MKNKILIILSIILITLLCIGLITSYLDSARVRNGIEPKYVIKLVNKTGNKVTYYGLGYKVIRYVSVSPNEPYKNNIGVKYGSWFMKYELEEKESITIELLMDSKKVEINKKEDIEFITSLLKDSKYINELCDGINTHKIIINNEVYYLKMSCKEIQKGNKQAEISEEDLNTLLKIIDDYNIDVIDDKEYEFTATIIEAYDNYIIVKPDEGTNEIKSSDKIRMSINRPTSGINDFYVEGNKVKITYNGNIEESYPARISAIKIELVS